MPPEDGELGARIERGSPKGLEERDLQEQSTGRAAFALTDADALARVRACVETTLAEVGPGFAHGYLRRMAENIDGAQAALAGLSTLELGGDPIADAAKPVVTDRRNRFSAGARIRGEDSI